MATTAKKTTPALGSSITNFIRKALGLDEGVGTFGVILSAVLVLFGAGILVFLLVASFGIGHTQLAEASKHRGSSVLGVLLLLGTIVWAWLNFTDRIPFQVSTFAFVVSLLILIVLIVNVNTDFFSKVY